MIPYWLGAPARCFYQDFIIGITEALRELGHEPEGFPFADVGKVSQREANSLLRQLRSDRPAAVLDLACWAYALSRVATTPQALEQYAVFRVHEIPYAGMLFDQPFNQALDGILASRLYAIYPDLGHSQQIKLVFPGLTCDEIFSPPGSGPQATGRPPPARSMFFTSEIWIWAPPGDFGMTAPTDTPRLSIPRSAMP